MSEKKVYGGLVALVVVMLIVALFRGGSDEQVAAEQLAAQLETANSDVAALTARLEELEGSIADVRDSTSGALTSDDLSASLVDVEARINALAEEAKAGTAGIEEKLTALQAKVGAAAALAEEAASRAADAPAEDADAAEEEIAAAEEPVADMPGSRPGETMIFADGFLRVFVSRVDAGAARLSINDALKTLQVGESYTLPVASDYCRISLDAAASGVAAIAALCGDELPAPEGLTVGRTAIFADGMLRAFVSRVNDASARLTVNGTNVLLDVGRSAPFKAGDLGCRVQLDAVDRGHAVVSALCGDDVTVSEPVAPGATVVLGDGAAHVFVAAVIEDEVRFAVNGLDVKTASLGDTVEVAEGCAVTVEDVMEKAASFSYACN